ncbi:hypothetical protein [Aureliella helgolandensis]|uniref:Uncharacterized protein n=1 Tax=Aureliella helgolandensis TaxID=2527968 RepID=A0A518GEB6_9BACT|nr:hypothetical protein [Aureliella helgolandensis]QDV26941.1 hypothetical protein Q31a_53210 [Aureliella helgolandensis]
MVTGIVAVVMVIIGLAVGAYGWRFVCDAELADLRTLLNRAVADRIDSRKQLEREIAELNSTVGKRSEEVMQLRKRIAKAETTNASLREELTTKSSNIADQKKFLGDLSAKFGTIAEKL